ncbi:MAG: HDIG domain-containing protein, partial [Pedobacter sp.]|nr:HDIG domain-containing protein [Pedobacter sp.]
MAKIRKNTQKILYRKYSSNIKYVLMVFTIFIVTLFLPKQPRFRYEFEKGKVWMNKDLVSPFSFAILKPTPQVKTDKKNALRDVFPIYQYDKGVSIEAIDGFLNEFDVKWQSAELGVKNKITYKTEGARLLKDIYAKGIIALNAKHQKGGVDYDFSLLEDNVEIQKNSQDVFTPETAIKYFKENFKTNNQVIADLMTNLAEDHLTPNISFSERLTQVVLENTVNSVSTTKGMVQKGELIVGKNDVIDEEIFQKLQSYKEAYDAQTKVVGSPTLVYIGQILLVTFILTILLSFLYFFRRDIFSDNRQLSLILMITTIMLLLLTWALRLNIVSIYYIPFCIVPIIIRILFDTRLALYQHLLVILIAGFFVANSFEFVFYQVTAGMVAIFSIKNFIQRERILISAVYILLAYFVSFLGIALLREGSFTEIEWINFVPFIFSVLLTLLAYPLIYVFERIFGITSDVSLIELTNTNTKLLRELGFKAPGTFQHSLQVANLAEAAIFKIGGNSVLVRAGALYHDIGKVDNPQYFIENQNTGNNPHDKLPYEQSAQIIIQHVHKGIEILRKNQIPEVIIDFIRTHHG